VIPEPVTLTGVGLTPELVLTVADEARQVTIDPAALARMDEAARVVRALARRQAVYGRTTGVGANHDQPASGTGLLASHAGGAGRLIPVREARALMVVRGNQLLVGASGVHPRMATALVDALNAGVVPAVHEYGAIGTGDLTALAETGLALSGDRPWLAGQATPVELAPTDALAFMSSSALTIGQAALAVAELDRLARAAVAVAALSASALRASTQPFAEAVHAARPHPGAVEVARRMRALVADTDPMNVQDPYGIRAFPQVHGVLLDELSRLRSVLAVELNTGAENPLVVGNDVLHHGGWHQASLAAALDGVRLALVSTAQLGAGRLSALMAGEIAFLAEPGGSGLLVLEYTAASAIAALRTLATPATLGHAVLSRGVENHASFASTAARQAQDAIRPYRVVLAAELIAAVRALRADGITVPDACAALPDERADRPLDGDLAIAAGLLDELA
jgi:histidine ammonia-lyase